jgi:hypothetical protein
MGNIGHNSWSPGLEFKYKAGTQNIQLQFLVEALGRQNYNFVTRKH